MPKMKQLKRRLQLTVSLDLLNDIDSEKVDKPERQERHLKRSHTVTALTSVPSLLFSVLTSDFLHEGRTSGPTY